MNYAAKPVSKYLALILFLVGALASAQSFDPVTTGVIEQQVSASVTPETPLPGQNVTISLSAYGTNLNTSSISWSVNGTEVQRGTGLTQFSITAGKNGQAKKVVATITTAEGVSVSRAFTISSQDVSIIYESDGYVPPFYKGKGVYATEGTITLVAIPNLISSSGTHLNPNNLVYTWSVDGTVQGSKSGYGKNSFAYTGSILAQEVNIQVDVSTGDKSTSGSSIIILSPLQPEVLLYEQSSLYGTLFNKELSSNGLSLTNKEVTVAAIPFSTSAATLGDGTLSYLWSINGDDIAVPKTQSFATFRNTTAQTGSSLIGLSVSNTTHLLQMMKNSLSINF